jgi:hypothetical protein
MFEIYAVHRVLQTMSISTRDKQTYYLVGHEQVEAWY